MAATTKLARQDGNDAFLAPGSMEIPSVPAFYKPLSLRLCKVLDNIGASEDKRKCNMETSITTEIMHSCTNKDKNISWYIFGSRTEGTTTYGLQSDVDFLYCHEPTEVLQGISDIPLQYDREYRLIVTEGNTKPGYCKLQMVKFGTPITRSQELKQSKQRGFQFDCNDKLCEIKVCVDLKFVTGTLHTAHGPAMAVPATSGTYGSDIVGAYRSRSWPNAASEWLYRERKYGWPSQVLIEKLKNLGFFVVKIGHPHSRERNLEWRISLSLQERFLMVSLNPTQFKCYILLKMVKKDVINKKLGVEAISSYHCKTCLFYMIENTPGDLWQPRNLLACLQGCLQCIYSWVKVGNCPNYFITGENMFEGRLDDEQRIKLEKICNVLLTADCSFMFSIQCDDVAKQMVNSVFDGTATLDSGILANQRLRYYFERVNCDLESSALVFRNITNSTIKKAVRKIFRCIYDLSHAIPITEHTSDQIKTAACIALPYLEISLISIIIAIKVELGELESVVDLLLSSKWQELSNKSDSFSAKLKQATFLYMVGQYEACIEVLNQLADNLSPCQISSCWCTEHDPKITEEMKFISFDEFRTSY